MCGLNTEHILVYQSAFVVSFAESPFNVTKTRIFAYCWLQKQRPGKSCCSTGVLLLSVALGCSSKYTSVVLVLTGRKGGGEQRPVFFKER